MNAVANFFANSSRNEFTRDQIYYWKRADPEPLKLMITIDGSIFIEHYFADGDAVSDLGVD